MRHSVKLGRKSFHWIFIHAKFPLKLYQKSAVVKKVVHNILSDPLWMYLVPWKYDLSCKNITMNRFQQCQLGNMRCCKPCSPPPPPTRLERISCPQCGNMSVHILHVLWTRTSERGRVEGMRKYFGHKSASRCERAPNYLRTHCPQYLWIYLEISKHPNILGNFVCLKKDKFSNMDVK